MSECVSGSHLSFCIAQLPPNSPVWALVKYLKVIAVGLFGSKTRLFDHSNDLIKILGAK